jgi:TatD DNase family protein
MQQPIIIDTHVHADATAFASDGGSNWHSIRQAARQMGVGLCVMPSTHAQNWQTVRQLAAQHHDAYALGIHPMCVPQATEQDLAQLDHLLSQCTPTDPRLVAVGEIGLDGFVPSLCTPDMHRKQLHFYRRQLQLAQKYQLPVLLHVRKSVDLVIKGLRDIKVPSGIAHAFNGSVQQAQQLVQLNMWLGAGGACTFDAATSLRQLLQTMPTTHWVLETDAPDMPPQWLYTTQCMRQQGHPQGVNTPAQLPRIGQHIAQLWQLDWFAAAHQTTINAQHALPKLAYLRHNHSK